MPSRRQFLRAAGVTVALPWLESSGHAAVAAAPPRRMLCIMADMGVLPGNFFPQTAGPGYESTPYLDILSAHRSRMTVFSGLSHQDNSDGHRSTRTFLSGAPQPTASNFRNTISIDQLVAEQIGSQTRFPMLPLLVCRIGTGTPSILRSGVEMPMIESAAAVYRKLFVQGSPAETEQRIAELKTGRSILDFVRTEARDLERRAEPAIANESTSSSARYATWSGPSKKETPGNGGRSRRSRRQSRRTSKTRRWNRRRTSCTTWPDWPSRPTAPAS